jgi:hypothetical protein
VGLNTHPVSLTFNLKLMENSNIELSETEAGIHYFNTCPICNNQNFIKGNYKSSVCCKISDNLCANCLSEIKNIVKFRYFNIALAIGTLILTIIMIAIIFYQLK